MWEIASRSVYPLGRYRNIQYPYLRKKKSVTTRRRCSGGCNAKNARSKGVKKLAGKKCFPVRRTSIPRSLTYSYTHTGTLHEKKVILAFLVEPQIMPPRGMSNRGDSQPNLSVEKAKSEELWTDVDNKTSKRSKIVEV
jgi:hypothetical protein